MESPNHHLPQISPSMRNDWRSCPRKVFFRHIAAIRVLGSKKAFAVGSAYHNGLEAWRNDPRRDAMAAGLVAANSYRTLIQRDGIADDGFTALQVMAYVVGYAVRFALSDVGSVVAETHVFDDGDAEIGFADCVIEFPDGRKFVVEDKTTARFEDETQMAWALRMNDQLSTYVAGLRGRGIDIHGGIYRQVKKTLTYPKKAESIEDYGNRVLEMYTTDQTLYREFVVTWGDIELKRREKERERTNLQIVEWLDRTEFDEWPYNPSSCLGAYGPCDYVRLCANNRDGATRCYEPNGKRSIDNGSYQRQIWHHWNPAEGTGSDVTPTGYDEASGEIAGA